MRFVRVVLAVSLIYLGQAHAQRELLGKVVKGDDQSRTPVDNISVSLDEDGSHDVTKDGGLFHLFLSDSLKPGVEITITVTMPGYAVYEPPGGKLTVPVDLIHRREIQLLLKGSPRFLSDTQLRAFIERTEREAYRTAAQSNTKEPPDLGRYLKDWAFQYGFSVDEVQAEVNRWASQVQSKTSDNYDLSLAAFAEKIAQKDAVIAAQTKVIVDLRTNNAALQKQVDELRSSPNPDTRSPIQIQALRDEIAAQNIKIRDLEDPLLKQELQKQLASTSGELELICESFGECMSRGQRAYHSDDFSAASAFFRQAAIVSPESTVAWHWVGYSSMASAHADEAYAAFDRIVDLHGSIPLTACEETGQPRCMGGTIYLAPGTFARYEGDEKIYEVSLSSVKILNPANSRSNSHITFDIAISGVSHVFDFFPMGFKCPWQGSVTCPKEGRDVQVKIGEYAARTIARLNSTAEAGPIRKPLTPSESTTSQVPPESSAETNPFVVQLIGPSGSQRVKIWPGSPASSSLLIERLDSAIIENAPYVDVVSLEINRKRVRIPVPGELFAIGMPGMPNEKTYQLCLKVRTGNEKRSYCFVSEFAVCSVGQFCKEGSDGGMAIERLADDIKKHLHR
jgi:hypothetical protein